MRIRMVHERSGPRWDGQPWPPPGGEIDVSDEEGAALCGLGIAVPVVADDAETPEQPDAAVETRGGSAVKPIVNSPKAAWVEHAVTLGVDRSEAEAMTKADLIIRLKE